MPFLDGWPILLCLWGCLCLQSGMPTCAESTKQQALCFPGIDKISRIRGTYTMAAVLEGFLLLRSQAFFLRRQQFVQLIQQSAKFLRVIFLLDTLAQQRHQFSFCGCHRD